MENSKNLQSGNSTMDVASRILGNVIYAFTRGDYQPFFFFTIRGGVVGFNESTGNWLTSFKTD